MQPKMLLQLIDELEQRFSPSASIANGFKRGMNVIWAELEEIHDEAYGPALKRLKIETNTLPTVERVRSVLQVEGKKAALRDSDHREREWHKKKGGSTPEEVRRQGSILSREQSEEQARETVQLMRWLLGGKMTQAQYLEGLRVLDAKYPNAGYGKEGAQLQRFWEKVAAGEEARL